MDVKNVFQKIATFLKEVNLEMRKVNWLSREEALKYTLIVIAISLLVALFLGSIDFIFTSLINKLIF